MNSMISSILKEEKKKLKKMWEETKKKRELEVAYKNVCALLLEEKEKLLIAEEKLTYKSVRDGWFDEFVEGAKKEIKEKEETLNIYRALLKNVVDGDTIKKMLENEQDLRIKKEIE